MTYCLVKEQAIFPYINTFHDARIFVVTRCISVQIMADILKCILVAICIEFCKEIG